MDTTTLGILVHDRQLVAALALGLVMVLYVAEVLWQVRLQARFLAALPVFARAALPPHPRQPWLAFASTPRFAVALWRSFRCDLPDDVAAVIALKRQMRASLRREFVLIALAVLAGGALIALEWRGP